MNSEGQETQQLLRQVQRLRRELCFMKRWAAVAGITLLALIVGLRASDRHRISTQQVVTKGLVLIDSVGRAQVRFAVFPEGSEIELQLIGDGEHTELNLYTPLTAEREGAAVNRFRNNVLLSSVRKSFGGAPLEMHSAAEEYAVEARPLPPSTACR